jgi:hypothetical protein
MVKELAVEVWTSRCGYGEIEESLAIQRVTIGPLIPKMKLSVFVQAKVHSTYQPLRIHSGRICILMVTLDFPTPGCATIYVWPFCEASKVSSMHMSLLILSHLFI